MEQHESSAASSGEGPQTLRVSGRRKRAEDAIFLSDPLSVEHRGDEMLTGKADVNLPTGVPAANDWRLAKSDVSLQKRKVLGNRKRAEDAVFLARPSTAEDSVDEAPARRGKEARPCLSESAAVIGTVLFSASVLLFLLSQTAAFLRATYTSLSPPFHTVAVVLVAALWALLVAAAVSLIRPLWRLRRSPRISLADMKVTDKKACKRFLTAIKSPEHDDLLRGCEWQERAPYESQQTHSIEGFNEALNRLCDPPEWDIANWLKEVEEKIIVPLDEAAEKLITRSAMSTLYSTAIAPKGLFDSMIVLGNCFVLTSQLCKLFGLRPSGPATALLVAHAMFNTLVAGGAGDATSEAEEAVQASLEDLLGAGAAVLLSKVTVRAAEGLVNGRLIKRFGRCVASEIRPIRGAA